MHLCNIDVAIVSSHDMLFFHVVSLLFFFICLGTNEYAPSLFNAVIKTLSETTLAVSD